MSYTANMDGVVAKIRKICTDRRVGIAAATSAANRMEQYVPRLSGDLRAIIQLEPWHVLYKVPYAHYQWALNTSNRTTPGTYSQWEKKANKGDIARDITAAIKRL